MDLTEKGKSKHFEIFPECSLWEDFLQSHHSWKGTSPTLDPFMLLILPKGLKGKLRNTFESHSPETHAQSQTEL